MSIGVTVSPVLTTLLPTRLPPQLSEMQLGLSAIRSAIEALGPEFVCRVVHVGHDNIADAGPAEAVIFSLSNPLEYRVVFDYCRVSGVPSVAEVRDTPMPIFIGGGIGFANPEPLASFFDVIIVDLDLDPLVQVLERIRNNRGATRPDLLTELSDIPNVYLPSKVHLEYGRSGEIRRIESDYLLTRRRGEMRNRPLSAKISVDEAVLMPDVGCKNRCSFCALAFHYDYRPAEVSDLTAEVDRLAQQGVTRFKLNSATASQYVGHTELLQHISGKGLRVALGSVRIDQIDPVHLRGLTSMQTMSDTQYLYRKRPTNGAPALTFGIEVASDRLFRLIRKGLKLDSVEERLTQLIDNGLRNTGFYFLAGIPTESADDRQAVAELISRAVLGLEPVDGEVFVNLNPLIPTPHTPMQRVQILSYAEFCEWVSSIREGVIQRVGAERFARRVRMASMSATDLLVETVTMRSDRRVGKLLALLYEDSASLPIDDARMDELLRQAGLPTLSFYRRRVPETEILPWHMVGSPRMAKEEAAYYLRECEATEAMP